MCMTKPSIIPISLHQPLKLKSFLYNVSKKLTLAGSNDIICNNNIKYNNIYIIISNSFSLGG